MENPSPSHTLRLTIPAIDEILGKEFPVLDHGFIRVIDYMGGDAAVVQAARVSYGTGTKKVTQDRGLIRYLMRHRHTTPFEMCEIKFHVKLPIFVARQWIRHRTASVNEYSARYSILDKEFYVPDRAYIEAAIAHEKHTKQVTKAHEVGQQILFDEELDRPPIEATAAQSTSNKQGRETLLGEDEATDVLKTISRTSSSAYSTYTRLLNEEQREDPSRAGIARELARIVLPTNYYTQWYWKTNLHNLLHFLALRADSHAQAEIREYAHVICSIVEKWVPHTWEAFKDYRQESVNLSSTEVSLLKKMLAGEPIDRSASGLSDREWNEFREKFGCIGD